MTDCEAIYFKSTCHLFELFTFFVQILEANFTLFYSKWKDGSINMSPACIAVQNVSRLDASFCS